MDPASLFPRLSETIVMEDRADARELRKTYHSSFSSILIRRRVRRSGRLTAWGRFLRFQNRFLYYVRTAIPRLGRIATYSRRSGRSGGVLGSATLLRQDVLLISLGFCRGWYQANLASYFRPLSFDGQISHRPGLWCSVGGFISINPASFVGRLLYFHRFQRRLRGNLGFLKWPACMEYDARTCLFFVYRRPIPSDFSGGSDIDFDGVFMFGGRR